MKDFLKGLLAMPLVVIAVAAVCWIGAIIIAVVGGIVGLIAVLLPYALRFVGIILVFGFIVWSLGKAITNIQQALKGSSESKTAR